MRYINKVKEVLEMDYDTVELKNGKFTCYNEYLDETHTITPVMFTNDDNNIGYELQAENKETNHKWQIGTMHVTGNV